MRGAEGSWGGGALTQKGETGGRKNGERQRERRVTQGKINPLEGAGKQEQKTIREAEEHRGGGGKIQRRRSRGDV